MKLRSEITRVLIIAMLAVCAAARSETPTVGVPDATVIGDKESLAARLRIPRSNKLGEDNSPDLPSSAARQLAETRSQNEAAFSPINMTQNFIGIGKRSEIREALAALPRTWSGSGVQNVTPGEPVGDRATANAPQENKAVLRESAVTHVTSIQGSRIMSWSLQALMFGSTIAAIETTQNCIQAGACTAVPTQFRARSAMYNTGIPLSAGLAILSYEMKKHRSRWWFVPPAMIIAADGIVTSHSVRYSN
jgi:hypothetical protein